MIAEIVGNNGISSETAVTARNVATASKYCSHCLIGRVRLRVDRATVAEETRTCRMTLEYPQPESLQLAELSLAVSGESWLVRRPISYRKKLIQ